MPACAGHEDREDTNIHPRGAIASELCFVSLLLQMRGRREDRVPAGTRRPAREKVTQRREDHRWRRRTLRPSLRGWFTAYFVLSSVSQCLFAPVASRQAFGARAKLGACVGAPGPHDFAVRKS